MLFEQNIVIIQYFTSDLVHHDDTKAYSEDMFSGCGEQEWFWPY